MPQLHLKGTQMNSKSLLATVTIFALAACGGGNDFEFWTKELSVQKNWAELSPESPPSDGPIDGAEISNVNEAIGIKDFQCAVTPYSLTETPREFVAIDPDRSIIWLGNLIQGDSHYNVGALEELSIRERSPLKISIDLLRGDNSRVIENPSLTSVQSAIGDLVESAVENGHEAASTATYDWEMAHSSSEASLRLGFAGEYLGGSASASLEVDSVGDEKSYLAYFIQRAFTVSAELPSEPSAVLSADFKPERLEALKISGDIGPDNPPLYISSVTYGRVLIYRMTSSHSEERVAAAIAASYEGTFKAEGYSEAEIKDTLASARISISTFGGNQANLESLIRSGRLQDYFTGDTKLSSMQPVSFELRNLSDNSLANITRTTEYDVKTCKYVSEPIGEKVTVTLEKFNVPGDCDPGLDQGDLYGTFYVNWTDGEGRAKSTALFNKGRKQITKVKSGDDFKINKSVTVERYFAGGKFEIKGELKDSDPATKGKDDQVGAWKFALTKRGDGQKTKTAHGSTCYPKNGNQPKMYYRITKGAPIYPDE